jgi:hypothetical protein
MRLRLSLCRGITGNPGYRLAGSNTYGAQSFKKVYAQVHLFDCEKGEKREKWPLLGNRGFLRKIGFSGERIFDF